MDWAQPPRLHASILSATSPSTPLHCTHQVVAWWENRKKTENNSEQGRAAGGAWWAGGVPRILVGWRWVGSTVRFDPALPPLSHHPPPSPALLPPGGNGMHMKRPCLATSHFPHTHHPPNHPPSRSPSPAGGNGMLMKRVASAGMLLAPLGLPLSKKVCLEYAPLAPGQHLPGQHFHPALPSPAQQPQYHHHGGSVYAAPEIVSHPLLGGGGGSGRLPDRLLPSPAAGAGADGDLQAQQQQQHNGTMHGGGGYLQQLTSTTSDLQLFGQLFGGGGGDGRGSQSPREDMQGNGTGLLDAGADGYQLPEAQREGSAENKEVREGGLGELAVCLRGATCALCRLPHPTPGRLPA